MQEGSDDEAEEVDSSDEEEDGKEEEEEGEFDCINKVMCFQTFINTTICTKHED